MTNHIVAKENGVLQFYKGEDRMKIEQDDDDIYILSNRWNESLLLNKNDIDDVILLLMKVKEKNYS